MTVEIKELTFECIIGILDFERTSPQSVVIDAVIEYDYCQGAYLDYAAVVALIKREMRSQEFGLIEEALEYLSAAINEQFPLSKSLILTIAKPSILPDCRVCVTKKSFF